MRESLSAQEIEESLGADAVGERSPEQMLRDGSNDVTFQTIAQDDSHGAEQRKTWAKGVLSKDRERRRREREDKKKAGAVEEHGQEQEGGRQ